MTLKTSTAAGSLDLSDALVSAAASHAERVAEITAVVLKEMDIVPDLRELRLPAGFLLELGAVAQIGVWELQGLHRQLNVDLPTQAEAATSLAELVANDPQSLFSVDSAVLSQRILRVFVENFAWSGHELFESDILVGAIDEDAFIDQLAHFLLENGPQVSKLLEQGRSPS